jgi:hypothetical protein
MTKSRHTVAHECTATPKILSLKNSIPQTIDFRIIVPILILIFEIWRIFENCLISN